MGTYTPNEKEVFYIILLNIKLKRNCQTWLFVICLYANSPKMKGSEQQNDVNVNIKQMILLL